MRNSIISKPFTASGTAIRSRIALFLKFLLRLTLRKRPRNRLSGSSDQMSGLTLRILAVNIIAIMILGLGILYLGQYTDSLVEGELAGFRSEARLFSGAISEGAVRPVYQISTIPFQSPQEIEAIKPELARRMVRRLGEIGKSRIRLYAIDGTVLADSHQISSGAEEVEMENLLPASPQVTLDSLFAQSATRFLDLIPMKTKFNAFPESNLDNIYTYPDTQSALGGEIKASAWKDENGRIVLSAAAPIQKGQQVIGIVLLLRDGSELEKAIAEVRVDVFRVFLGSLGITVMLSIYLSGLISRPLQRLAAAAEAVRQGKGRYIEIPDMSHRNDEIGELSLSLRDMTLALFARMDSIERFAADVAHEIKNPLTSLRSAVETARVIKDEEKRVKLLDIIQHDVQRLDRLISDISSASRLDAELSRDEMTPVDLSALMYRLRDAYKKPLQRSGEGQEEDMRILLDLPQTPVFVRGNTDRLSQVFGNLISNALSFSPQDGKVVVRISLQPENILVQVDDEGPGIPENKLDTIFERFYTERPQHEGYGNHSGLGLSISKQIVQSHNGKIWAENLKGENGTVKGARFNVLLQKA
jgi:two-component system sensor histidine kinase ChvG